MTRSYDDDGEEKRKGIERLCAQMQDMKIVVQLGSWRGDERMLTERQSKKQEQALARMEESNEKEALARKNRVEIFGRPSCKVCEGPMHPRSGPKLPSDSNFHVPHLLG